MCTIAGYTGSGRAAPILLEMLRREEGLDSGFYTGLATIDHGKLYYAKVVGDSETLIRTTDALDLPGTCGIIHSRTPSGGDREWAHPFISCDESLALAANGSLGVFRDRTDFGQVAWDLIQKGHSIRSRCPGSVASYSMLPDGTCAHLSDIHCHLIEESIRHGLSVPQAMIDTLRDYPCQDVIVTVHTRHPDSLFAVRNMSPMFRYSNGTETFIASTPTAFGPSVPLQDCSLLPTNYCFELTPSAQYNHGIMDPSLRIGEITPELLERTLSMIREAVSESAGPVRFSELSRRCKTFFPADVLPQSAPLAYRALDILLRNGTVALTESRIAGMEEGLTAPLFCAVPAGSGTPSADV